MPVINEINFKVNMTYGDSSLSDQNSEEAKLIMFILWGIILPLVVGAGLVGNILTIIVLWRREMHSTTILYLRGLVISDTGILIGSLVTLTPLSCANYLHGENLEYFRDNIYPIIHTPGYYIMMTLQSVNVWITVSVSVERYIAICHPFRAARLITRRKTIIVLVSIVIISLIYNVPHLFSTKTSSCSGQHPPPQPSETKIAVAINGGSSLGSNASFTSPRPLPVYTTIPQPTPPFECLELATTEFGNTQLYLKYRTVLYSIIIYIIPLLGLFFLNIFLIRELMIMQRRRSNTNIHDENEANLSLVLVLIVIVFIFCQTPGLISQFDLIRVDIFVNWLTFSNLLFTTNSAVNFLIYTAFGRKFRHVLLRVFRHVCKKNRRQSQPSFRLTQYTETEFDTCEPTEMNCTPLRSVSCYRKEVKAVAEANDHVPLNTESQTQTTAVNGISRRTNSNNGTGNILCSKPQDDGDIEIAANGETTETTAILPPANLDHTLCTDDDNIKS